MIRIPGTNAVVETAPREWVHSLQPLGVSGDLPVAIELHDSAELAVRCGVPAMIDGAVGDGAAEVHMAVVVHGALIFHVAKGALELRVKMRKGLRVVPDMRARSVAAAAVRKAAFPSPHVSVLLAEDGWRLENAKVG